jgi:g-D-glutamyl-meso-diaminopimelate peptidase
MDIYEEVTRFYESVKTEKKIIEKSLFGHSMYAFKAGKGTPVGLVQCAMHGREYITAKLAIEHFKRGIARGSVWLVPLVNPDGALLSEIGSSTAPETQREYLLSVNGKTDFSLWKANGRGVDLNVNFAAHSGKGAKNVFRPSSENYVGEKPFSEPETRALKVFTETIRPDYTISFHTKGEEIYWRFFQPKFEQERDRVLAEVISQVTGYPLKEAQGSVGGYKDWCVETLKIPAFTLEVGKDEYAHPLGEDALKDIIEKNIDVLDVLSKAYQI